MGEAMTRKLAAAFMVLVGSACLLVGVASIYWPAALVLAGAGVICLGLFGIGVE